MQPHDSTRLILDTLAAHLKQTKAAYYAGMPGVTYDDMAAAAARLLRMRAVCEQAGGKKATSAPTPGQIATLLRNG